MMMRRREWILVLMFLLVGLALSRNAEAFGFRKRKLATTYPGAGRLRVPVTPAGSPYAPSYNAPYDSRPGDAGYAGGGPPGSGYGGGYYGLQGYNNNALGTGTAGSGRFRIVLGIHP
jgi:hypothetical protein